MPPLWEVKVKRKVPPLWEVKVRGYPPPLWPLNSVADPDPKDPNHFAGSGSEIIVSDPDPKRISKCWNYPKCETNFKELVTK